MNKIEIKLKNNDKEADLVTGVTINTHNNGISTLNFFNEYLEMPDKTHITVSDDGTTVEDFSNNIIVREIKAKVTLNIDSLQGLSKLLLSHLEQFELEDGEKYDISIDKQ